jgi:GAF domain-containing protein
MGTSGWSTQQLAEFVAAVSAAENEASAAATAVERVAEALDAEVAAIVCDGELIAAIGYPGGIAPIGELEAVEPGVEGSAFEVPGFGTGSASAAPLEHPPGARLVVARGGATGLSREETGLLRGMARVASMTMRMLRVLDDERAAREEVERLALDQAALRRVATLVAKAAPRENIYAAVAAEIAQRLGADVGAVLRYEANGTATIIGGWGVPGEQIPIGTQLRVAGEGVAVSVWQTRRPARVERFDGPPGSVAACFRSLGVHTGVGCPIMVDDDLWGVAFAATARRGALPAGSEARIAEFTQLVSAAIANAEARVEVRRIADEQAALRRVATLVARGAGADEVFGAVASETRTVLDSDISTLLRLEPDGMITVMATESTLSPVVAVGERHKPLPGGAVERALQTGRTARTEGYEGESGSVGAHLRALRYGGSASAPIVVADRLWGVISVVWAQGRSVPAGGEERLMQFGELIATALANAEARADLRQVAEEQAALRRVATLVARGEPPSAVFAAVAVEAGRVIPAADVALVGRYDPDNALEFVGGWSRDGDPSFVGDRVPLGGENVTTVVFQSNRPARRDHIPDDSTPASTLARKWARSSAGAPINVEGRLWGVMIVGGADEEALPAGTEHRLAQFSELVATAIGNAEAREELRRVADEQAALRRVATLVARDDAPEAAFAAVTEELAHLFHAEAAGVNRHEMDGTVTSVGSWNSVGQATVGTRTTLGGHNVTTLVFETGQPARIDRYDADDASSATSIARRHGARSAAGAPIRVAGRIWGSVQVAMSREAVLPARTEERLAAFAELTASAIAKAQARQELRRVADDQAALRRVATLVARAAPPAEVFAAVAAEVGRLLSMEGAGVLRYDGDRSATVVGGWSGTGDDPRIGLTIPLGGQNAVTRVFETGRPARIEYAPDDSNAATAHGREAGGQAALGAPIGVAGRLWGAVVLVARGEDTLTTETETRLVAFTELVATAIANAQAREELRRVADEQAALRRVATLVAAAAPPAQVFASVAEEVGRLLQVDRAFVARYEADESVSIVAGWSSTGATLPVGARGPVEDGSVSDLVRSTGGAARIDAYPDYPDYPGGLPDAVGMRSSVGVPILVENRLWGLVATGSGGGEPPSAETEERLTKFTELVATAIANANARAEVTASRARIVASADEARRKIERDLHDGAQAQLVTLVLQVRAAQEVLPADDLLAAELERVATGLTSALDELRELASGIHPPILASGGLGPAVRMLGRRARIPVDVDVRMADRLPKPVEVGAYYVVSEALTNAVKHSEATSVAVEIEVADAVLRIVVQDDGVGGAEFARGSGLLGLRDRVEALGGRIALESERGAGTSLSVELPLSPDQAAVAQ